MLPESGHHVADRFLRFGGSTADRFSNHLQDRLNVGGEGCQMIIDAQRFVHLCHLRINPMS